jgi:hypothetical protein
VTPFVDGERFPPDDRRFLMIRERGGERGSLALVDNWFQELMAAANRTFCVAHVPETPA